jgi:hypothetical protein
MLPTCSKPSFLRMPEQTAKDSKIGTCFASAGFGPGRKKDSNQSGFWPLGAASEMTLPAASEALHPRTQEPNG